jgi:hypothetical protein
MPPYPSVRVRVGAWQDPAAAVPPPAGAGLAAVGRRARRRPRRPRPRPPAGRTRRRSPAAPGLCAAVSATAGSRTPTVGGLVPSWSARAAAGPVPTSLSRPGRRRGGDRCLRRPAGPFRRRGHAGDAPWTPTPMPSAGELLGDNLRRRLRGLGRRLSSLADPAGTLPRARHAAGAWREFFAERAPHTGKLAADRAAGQATLGAGSGQPDRAWSPSFERPFGPSPVRLPEEGSREQRSNRSVTSWPRHAACNV